MQRTVCILLLISVILTVFFAVLLVFQHNRDWLLDMQHFTRRRSETQSHQYVQIPAVTVSISGGDDHFCKAGFTLAVAGRHGRALKSPSSLHRIQSTMSDIIGGYGFANLSTLTGKLQLKEHIRESLNGHLGGTVVQEVYFSELLLQ